MRVGLIGCGRIAFEAHLPAYQKYHVKVVAVCDLIEEMAMKASDQYLIPYFYTDALQLAANPEVDVLDIATSPQGRGELLRSLLPFNKPMLIQKPVSYDYDEAQKICEEFDQNGLLAAVNHNARFAPVNMKLKSLIQEQKLGEIYQIHHVNRYNENLKTWYTEVEDYLFLDHGLHYFDLVRLFAGQMPSHVSAITTRKPGQVAACPLAYTINLRFKNDLIASLYFNNAVPAPHSFACHWFIDGSLGSVHGTIDSISHYSEKETLISAERLEGDWVPEGFWGTYKHFILAIQSKTVPTHSLKDHLQTLKIAIAAAQSSKQQGQWIEI